MKSSFATRTLPPRRADGWPLGASHLRSFLLSLSGVALGAVNLVMLRAAWALGSGASAWEAHLAALRSASALALHALLCAIACGFALGFLAVVARGRAKVFACGGLALVAAAALVMALCAGAIA